MPLYEFECCDCGNNFEVRVKADEKHTVKCTRCGSTSLKPKFGFMSFLKNSCSLGGHNSFG